MASATQGITRKLMAWAASCRRRSRLCSNNGRRKSTSIGSTIKKMRGITRAASQAVGNQRPHARPSYMAPGTAYANRFCNARKKGITDQAERRPEDRTIQRLSSSMIGNKRNKGLELAHFLLAVTLPSPHQAVHHRNRLGGRMACLPDLTAKPILHHPDNRSQP